jgi:hypothetical protein
MRTPWADYRRRRGPRQDVYHSRLWISAAGFSAVAAAAAYCGWHVRRREGRRRIAASA